MSPTYPESLSINKGRYSGDTATALVDGAVAEPSIAFADDSDTGIYSPADGQVCLTVDGEDAVKCMAGGAVEINHNNNKKLETISDGIQITGDLGIGVAPNNVGSQRTLHIKGPSGEGAAIRLQDATDTADSNDFTIYKNYANAYLRVNGTDPLIFYLNSGERLTIKSDGRVGIPDDGKFVCGTNEDLEVWHDGNNSRIHDTGTGVLAISGSDVHIQNGNQSQSIAKFLGGNTNSSAELYYNDVKKFETTSTGAVVTSDGNAYGLQVNSTGKAICRLQTTSGTDEGAELSFFKNSPSIADGDQLGYIQFGGVDAAGNGTLYAAIIGYGVDVSDGDEGGELKFFTRDNGSFSLKLTIAENGTFTGSSSNDISDQRLKENITTVTNATDKIKALKGRTFTWKPEAKLPGGTHYGFIAQEVESVVSDLVDDTVGIRQFDKDGNLIEQDEKAVENHDEGTTYAKSVNAIGVVPILVEALKEAIAEIETLKTKVAALEAG